MDRTDTVEVSQKSRLATGTVAEGKRMGKVATEAMELGRAVVRTMVEEQEEDVVTVAIRVVAVMAT